MALESIAVSSLGGYFHLWPNGRASIDIDDVDLMELTAAILWWMAHMNHNSQDIFRAVDERLETARFGLRDMSNPAKARSGLYNAVVFGRMVTFALQNLRSIANDFDEWYRPKQEEMRADPLMRYFHELRTKIEKCAGKHIYASGHINLLRLPNDIDRFQPAPPNAVGFFIGDENGGSGWIIRSFDGSGWKILYRFTS
jgi:hypothetical protein